MTTLSKDEIIAWAREAQQQATTTQERTSFLDADLFHTKFAHLCRADLVVDWNKQVSIALSLEKERDALRAELSALRAGSGEPVAWQENKTGNLSATLRDERLWTPLYPHPRPSAVPVVKQLVEALEAVEALIEHQYTGTREGMTYLQNTCDDAQDALTTGQQWLKENT